MQRYAALAALLCFAIPPAHPEPRTKHPEDLVIDYKLFQDPPKEDRGHRWLTLRLDSVTEESLRNTIQQATKSDVAGSFMITPDGGNTSELSPAYLQYSHRPEVKTGIAYLSEKYFRLYRAAIEEGNKDGLPLRRPLRRNAISQRHGRRAPLFKHPEAAAKSLQMIEKDIAGPATAQLDIPIADGIYVGSVMMNLDTYERLVVSGGRSTRFQIPRGDWKAMLFSTRPSARNPKKAASSITSIPMPSSSPIHRTRRSMRKWC